MRIGRGKRVLVLLQKAIGYKCKDFITNLPVKPIIFINN